MLHKGRFKISDLQPEPTRVEDNSVYIKRTKIGRFIETTHIEPVPKSSKVGRFKLSNLNTENHGNFENSGNIEIIKKRTEGLNKIDEGKPLRKSHENKYVQELYEKYLGEPLGPIAHNLLHTKYFEKIKK